MVESGGTGVWGFRGKYEKLEVKWLFRYLVNYFLVSRLLKNYFFDEKPCENPNDFWGQFFKTRLFQQPVRQLRLAIGGVAPGKLLCQRAAAVAKARAGGSTPGQGPVD